MKRPVLLLMIWIGSFFWTQALAQVYVDIKAGVFFENQQDPYERMLRKEVRELHLFRDKVNRFIILSDEAEWVRADMLRASILRDMEDEIQQTHLKLDYHYKYHRSYYHEPQIYSKRDTRELSKRSTYSKRRDSRDYREYYDERREVSMLENRLREQKKVLGQLAHIRLEHGYDAWRKSKFIERLMIDFENTLVEEIRYLRRDIVLDDNRSRGRRR